MMAMLPARTVRRFLPESRAERKLRRAPHRSSDRHVRPSRLSPLLLAAAVSSLFVGVKGAGIWDPYEVRVAELARRIALNLLGAKGAFVPGTATSVPIRS